MPHHLRNLPPSSHIVTFAIFNENIKICIFSPKNEKLDFFLFEYFYWHQMKRKHERKKFVSLFFKKAVLTFLAKWCQNPQKAWFYTKIVKKIEFCMVSIVIFHGDGIADNKLSKNWGLNLLLLKNNIHLKMPFCTVSQQCYVGLPRLWVGL